MNTRRGFIASIATAICGAAIPASLGFWRGTPEGGGVRVTSFTKPRRCVLVMASWWTPERYELLSAHPLPMATLSRMVNWREHRLVGTSVVLRSPLQEDWANPRIAHTWKEIRFEELKRGDHFLLIDESQVPGAGNEDGKEVSVALSDATIPSSNPDHVYVTFDPSQSYPGRGARFDWREIIWGEEYDRRRA